MRFGLPLLLAMTAPALSRAADPALDFFEQKIRPVLVKECYSCHSVDSKKMKGGLLLDTKEGIRKGGDTSAAVTPNKPEESLLLQALLYDDLKMPPKGKLPDSVRADFEKWIKMGAPDPRDGAVAAKKGMSVEEGKKFWAYQPVKAPAVPDVKDAWATTEIDRFLLARLKKDMLKPSADADKLTLVRRLYFDLVGLPPTPEQIDAFVKDARPDAYEKLVDQLLGSHAFGERWGRHWLDIARYAESLTLRGFVLPDTWRYRDYVIDAYNSDKPFNRMIREQLAGDLLKADGLDEKRKDLVALQYLLMGNTNLEEQDKKGLVMDIVDEQIDVITKGLLGQTVACARCHDHKFDPIPTKDYYALAGVLFSTRTVEHSNVSKWLDQSLPVEPEVEKAIKQKETKIAALQKQVKDLKAKTVVAAKDPKEPAAKGIMKVSALPGVVVDDANVKAVGEWVASTHSGNFIGDGYKHDGNKNKGQMTLTFSPEIPAAGKYEIWFAYSPGTTRSNNTPVTVMSADGEKVLHIDQTKAPNIDGRFVSLGTYKFEKGTNGYVIVSNEDTKGHVTADAMVFVPEEKEQGTKAKAKAKESSNPEIKKLEDEIAELTAKGPVRETVMGLKEDGKPTDLKIHIRGSLGNLGAVAPRGVMQVATWDKAPEMPKDQSGRLQLADWIAADQNPLTARVYVNRVWHWIFGAGIVKSVDNFGTTGDLPTHPELLDHLAAKFIADGWSTKKLVKSLVMSHAYRQSSTADKETLAKDPENKLLGRMSMRRLDAECIRDAMLVVAGTLEDKKGGPSTDKAPATDYGFQHRDAKQRSVYLPVFRNSIPQIFEVFDFADASMVTGARDVSTVAPQALFLLNHPAVLERAEAAAARIKKETQVESEQVTAAYRLALGRTPTDAETANALKANDLEGLVQALFASIEFRYVK